MNRTIIALAATLAACTVNASSSDAWMLYRGNPMIESGRDHVATFDADARSASFRAMVAPEKGLTAAGSYNYWNCEKAAQLLESQPASIAIPALYWCERR